MNANEPNDPNQGPVESTQVVPAADERAAFENWASDSGQWPKAIQRNVDGYLLAITQAFWSAWMARAALAAEPVRPQEPLPPGFDRASLMDLADWLAEHDKTINPTPPRAGTMTSLAYAEAFIRAALAVKPQGEPPDEQLQAAFERSSGGPYFRCKTCGMTEPGVKTCLAEHFKKCNAIAAPGMVLVPLKPTVAALDNASTLLAAVMDELRFQMSQDLFDHIDAYLASLVRPTAQGERA